MDFSQFDSERLREEEVYNWISSREDILGIRKNPLKFVIDLDKAARAYLNFSEGKNEDGSKNPYLTNIRFLSGAAARIHLAIPMSARHLSLLNFQELCNQLEQILFVLFICRVPSNFLEKSINPWTKELRSINDQEGLKKFIEKNFNPIKTAYAGQFDLALREFSESKAKKYQVKYILAKLSHYIDEMARGQKRSQMDITDYMESVVTIEHILSQTPTQNTKEGFDRPEEIKNYMERLGNLTLLEESINKSIGNGMFREKKHAYRKSMFLLTQSLVADISFGKDTAFSRASSLTEIYETWDSAAIETRQLRLTKLSREVWGVPSPPQ